MSYTRQAFMCNVCVCGRYDRYLDNRPGRMSHCVCVYVCSSTLEGQPGRGVRPQAHATTAGFLRAYCARTSFFIK